MVCARLQGLKSLPFPAFRANPSEIATCYTLETNELQVFYQVFLKLEFSYNCINANFIIAGLFLSFICSGVLYLHCYFAVFAFSRINYCLVIRFVN